MADVNSTTTQNQTQQQPQTAPQNQPTQASGTQQQPQTDKHEENNSGGEVTVESLMAQLAQEKAANAKLKSDNDKLCTSEGNLRKQLTEQVLENTTYIKFIFYKMKNPYSRLRIYSIQLGYGLVYYNDDIMDSKLDSYISPICEDVPQIDFPYCYRRSFDCGRQFCF